MKLLGGVLLLLGVLLIERGLAHPTPTQRIRRALSEGRIIAPYVLDEGDQGGWPTHDGGAA